MAHETQIIGRLSEITAHHALIAAGWEVAEPSTTEPYDVVAKDPLTGKWHTIQIKTIRRRKDRGNEMVVYAKKSNGANYSMEDCDYLVGVEPITGATYMFENRGIGEYWATDESSETRWIKLA